MLSLFSHFRLCDPWQATLDCSLPGSSVHGILQGWVLEWAAMPSSRGSSRPRDGTHVSYIYLNWQVDYIPLGSPHFSWALAKWGQEFQFINDEGQQERERSRNVEISENPNKQSSPKSKIKDFLCQPFTQVIFLLHPYFIDRTKASSIMGLSPHSQPLEELGGESMSVLPQCVCCRNASHLLFPPTDIMAHTVGEIIFCWIKVHWEKCFYALLGCQEPDSILCISRNKCSQRPTEMTC